MLNSEQIKPVTITIIELRYLKVLVSKYIVSQSVSVK